MPGGSVNTTGREPPSNKAAGYDSKQLTDTSSADNVIPVNTETSSVIIRARPNNSGIVYIGFDDSVDTSTGFPLEASDTLIMEVDNVEVTIFAIPDTANDELRWLALE